MRHQVAGRKLSRTTAHRKALFRNLVAALVDKERIETTLPKAKDLRSFADHLITLGKKDTLSARRQAFELVRSKFLVRKIFTDLAQRFNGRSGGYTRVLKLGHRHGDAAPMAIIEYLPEARKELEVKEAKPSKVAKLAKKSVAPKAKKESPKAKKAASAKATKSTAKKQKAKSKSTKKSSKKSKS